MSWKNSHENIENINNVLSGLDFSASSSFFKKPCTHLINVKATEHRLTPLYAYNTQIVVPAYLLWLVDWCQEAVLKRCFFFVWRHLAAGMLTIHLPVTRCVPLERSVEGHAPGTKQSGEAAVQWVTTEELFAQKICGWPEVIYLCPDLLYTILSLFLHPSLLLNVKLQSKKRPQRLTRIQEATIWQ